MTVTTELPDLKSVVRALSAADVQFVVVGAPAAGQPLGIVVSRHPTNLDALGRALDRLGSRVRAPAGSAPGESPRRVGDPLGTVSVTTSAGDVDLMFGGARRSLYAEVAGYAQPLDIGGLWVQWARELTRLEPAPRTTSRVLGRRLLSLAEGLSHLIERHDEPSMERELAVDGEADVET
ncbi:MAG TPA: hypothetical protein VMD28_03515 [Acidimicrobiales bacterium]|nr:hypothetical protein [Acidimicrobiales bacterium]